MATSWDPLLGLMGRAERLAEPTGSGWTPPVDIVETPEAYILTVDVPGLEADAVSVSVSGSRVTLSGRRGPAVDSDIRYHRIERGQGSFSRTFSFPGPVEADCISADALDGILTVTLPKREGARRVEIT